MSDYDIVYDSPFVVLPAHFQDGKDTTKIEGLLEHEINPVIVRLSTIMGAWPSRYPKKTWLHLSSGGFLVDKTMGELIKLINKAPKAHFEHNCDE